MSPPIRRGQKAWLLTWEWGGLHAAVEDHIAGILRPRLTRRIVSEIVQSMYAIHDCTPTELAVWARRHKENPFKAQWDNDHCFCGNNPSLHAMYVHDLVIKEDPQSGLETISWVYPPLCRLNNTTMQIEQVRGNLPRSVTRTITGTLSDREIGRYRDLPPGTNSDTMLVCKYKKRNKNGF